MTKRVYRYSEAFKLKVIDELERGVYGSPFELARAYGIGNPATVQRWARQYGKGHVLKKVVRVEKEGEAGEITRLKQRVRMLEEMLVDAHAEALLNEAYFEILCEDVKIEPGEFKKKRAGERSIRRVKGEESTKR